jgi:hypothetical protein
MLTIPVAWFIFKLGYPPYSIFLVTICIGIFAVFVRLYFGKNVAGMNIHLFFKNGILPVILPLFLATGTALIPQLVMPPNFFRLCISVSASLLMLSASFWYFGLKQEEASKLKQIANSAFKKLSFKTRVH